MHYILRYLRRYCYQSLVHLVEDQVLAVLVEVSHRSVDLLVWSLLGWNLRQRGSHRLEIIPTPGLPILGLKGADPGWQIGACFLTEYSKTFWIAGYGFWYMFFDPFVVREVMKIARTFPASLDEGDRWRKIFEFFYTLPRHATDTEPVFSQQE